MSRLLFWAPDSFMSVAIALIALGLIVGFLRPRRAFSSVGLIALILLSGPFIDALAGYLWTILPLWVILPALPFVFLAVVRSACRLLLGTRATDHMTGILAAHGVLWSLRKVFKLFTFPFRFVLRRF